MFRNISYRQKFKLTITFGLVVLFLCYQFSIRKTIGQFQLYSEGTQAVGKQSQVESFEDVKRKERTINAVIDHFVLDTLRPEKNLLSVTSNYCKTNGIRLKEYKPYHFSKNDSIQVLTRVVTVEGGFISCLRLLYALENVNEVGKLSEVDFKSYVDPQDKNTKLNCTFYIQNLISYDHENR